MLDSMKARASFSTFAIELVILMIALGGCTNGVDRAVFVTKTSLSVLDVDSTPPSISVAYDRTEGFFGPSYQSGGIPPVVGIVRSDGKVLNPKVQQLYATGNAARVISGVKANGDDDLSGDKKNLFFGTSTTTGLKIGFDATTTGSVIPNSFIFGFRRKEYSVLPLGKKADDKSDNYPSVLAAIDNSGEAGVSESGNKPFAGLKISQYFATGIAATNLAGSVKDEFGEATEDAFGEYRATLQKQRLLAGEILYCYSAVPVSKRLAVLADAVRLELLPAEDDGAGFQDMKKALEDPAVYDRENNIVRKPDIVAQIDGTYAHNVYPGADGFDAARTRLMEIHKKSVCETASATE